MAEFIDGITVKQPHEKAPDFVIADLAIQADKLIDWLQKNKNDRGYVNGTIKRSQKGTLYVEKNTYQAQSSNQRSQPAATEDDQSDLPF